MWGYRGEDQVTPAIKHAWAWGSNLYCEVLQLPFQRDLLSGPNKYKLPILPARQEDYINQFSIFFSFILSHILCCFIVFLICIYAFIHTHIIPLYAFNSVGTPFDFTFIKTWYIFIMIIYTLWPLVLYQGFLLFILRFH